MNKTIDRDEINRQMASLLSLGRDPVEVPLEVKPKPAAAKLDLSIIFFSDINQGMDHKYQLVFDLTEFADRHGFTAVWLPERHFHPFGGIYPNPSVLAAALAVKTKQIRLRTGSVVLPLHHPIEVVEAWSMVDHLSQGRVDLGFASGWNPNDFIISRDTFGEHRKIWFDRIPIVEKLWRGESMTFQNGKDEPSDIRIYPKPIQETLNVWLVVSRSEESFRIAGSKGYNVLTMLAGIDLAKLSEKIKIYRDARRDNGFDPEGGVVTLMMHTLVHRNLDIVRKAVREPFYDYIKSALTGHVQAFDKGQRPSEEETKKMVDYSYERYFKTGALFGSLAEAQDIAEKAVNAGVNEIACLMDFGVDYKVVMESLPYLLEFKETVSQ
ncbi:LLM class flavin-dependent oxidoreductase [Sulfidibacter corallicola]|uniref:LLM class flavin-dependent oxidoreductase n=1 Tax=Sulfidibacter corallicola TaxID=2818388 RepID=A0A8A4TVB5_SULCO|nr:MupA/Atu3671 family FMN-dependent luciferase-like monooxygenase [Sulfidibacter corallicola]QTD53423.1 LLM class flavin-dependent oxidoreductase [Sulfidibacter corallicola]